MTKDLAKEIFPVLKITTTAEQAIRRCFDVEWQPRVVRQNKQPRAGSLKHVDYAIPCFELARQLKQPIEAVADRLAVCIREILEAGTGVSSIDMRVEAVAGFVNFELSDAYFVTAIAAARSWFRAPDFIGRVQKHDYIVVEPRLVARAPRQQITALAYDVLDGLHGLLHYPLAGHFLLSDYSHETLVHVTAGRRYRPLKKSDGRVVQNHELLTDDRIAPSIEQMRSWWTRHHTPLQSRSSTPYQIHTESELAEDIHGFLDGLETVDAGDGIICDEANQAVYFVHGDQAIPLRSASGLLFRAASALFVINRQLQKGDEHNQLVILATQKMHPLIYAFVSTAHPELSVTCFDPYVAKADITLISQSIASLRGHFIRIGAILHKPTKTSHDPEMRTALLSLVDLPVELSSFLAANQLPGLFDAIGNSVTTTRHLRVQHGMKVAAN